MEQVLGLRSEPCILRSNDSVLPAVSMDEASGRRCKGRPPWPSVAVEDGKNIYT